MKQKSNSELKKLEDAARAAWLYYVAKNTQDEIAQKLDVSRQSAQRLIALAVSEGLIKVRLEHPITRCMELAEQLKTAFNLLECEVAPSDPTDINSTYGLAQSGAKILERYLKSKQPKTLAFGTGRSLKACIEELPNMDCEQHKLVSIVGNMMQDGSASKFDIVVSMANRVNAKHFPLPLPLFAQTQAQKHLLHDLAPVKNIFQLAANADATFVGIGHMTKNSPLLMDGFIEPEQLHSFQETGVAGEVVSWLYDENGKLISNELTQCLLSTPLQINTDKPVFGIAAGPEKVTALTSALKGKLINSLITNEYTAEQILKRIS